MHATAWPLLQHRVKQTDLDEHCRTVFSKPLRPSVSSSLSVDERPQFSNHPRAIEAYGHSSSGIVTP